MIILIPGTEEPFMLKIKIKIFLTSIYAKKNA
jgi:hypothetical protein